MKNIKIGGNVYQDVEHVHFKDENGNDVTFVDADVFSNKYVSASFESVQLGFNILNESKTLEYPKVVSYSSGATIK